MYFLYLSLMKLIFIEHQRYVSTVVGNGATRQSIADIIITHGDLNAVGKRY